MVNFTFLPDFILPEKNPTIVVSSQLLVKIPKVMTTKPWYYNPDIDDAGGDVLKCVPFQILSSVAIILTLRVDFKPKCFATNLGSNGNFAKIHKSSLYT